MNASRARMADLADATGFRLEAVERVVRLGELLADISVHPLLSDSLILKGGTPLNLAFGDPPRLSVDLDLNYVRAPERERMLADRPEIERAVDVVARARGYKPQRSPEDHAGRKIYLGFINASRTPDRIEIDLNFLFRIPLGPSVRRMALWQPGDLDRPVFPVVPPEELLAGKLCALLARAAPRDLFDVARLPGRLPDVWASASFRSTFVGLAGILDHPLPSYGPDRLDRADEAAVRTQLHPMLISGVEPSAAELRRAAWEAVAPLVALTDAEREYTDRLQLGELRPELLFPDDPEAAERLRRHPALLWKSNNAREHANRGQRAKGKI